jgi:hypothetical protein
VGRCDLESYPGGFLGPEKAQKSMFSEWIQNEHVRRTRQYEPNAT